MSWGWEMKEQLGIELKHIKLEHLPKELALCNLTEWCSKAISCICEH